MTTNLGSSIKQGWNYFTKDVKFSLIATAITLGSYFLIAFAIMLPVIILPTLGRSRSVNENLVTLIFYGFIIIASPFLIHAGIAYRRTIFLNYYKPTISLSDFFHNLGENLSRTLLFCLIWGLVGLIPIYNIIFWLRTWLVPEIMAVHDDYTVSECIDESKKLWREYYSDIFLTKFVANLISSGSSSVCCFGVLLGWPIEMGMNLSMYLEIANIEPPDDNENIDEIPPADDLPYPAE